MKFRRSVYSATALCVMVVCGGRLRALPSATDKPRLVTEIDTRFDTTGSFQNRLSATVETPSGPIWAYASEEVDVRASEPPGSVPPRVGFASPKFDIGPVREGGLVRELNRPAGIGGIRERSGAFLDRTYDTKASPGGVLRFLDAGGTRLEIYGLERGGMAPPGTRSGGVLFAKQLGRSIEVDVATKTTLFGESETADDWFLSAPAIGSPSVLRGGVRVSAHIGEMRAHVAAGTALSDCAPASGFVSGFGTLSRRFSLNEQVQGKCTGRLDIGLIDPTYFDDDGRFTNRTTVIHPLILVHVPGLDIAGGYEYRLYRLPLLPVVDRRLVQDGSLEATVDFGLLAVGCGIRPRIEYSEEGRTLFRRTSSLSAAVGSGSILLRGELTFVHSNTETGEIEADLSTAASYHAVHLDLRLRLRRRKGTAAADLVLPFVFGNLQVGGTIDELVRLEPDRMGLRLNGPLSDVLKRAELYLRWKCSSEQ